MENMHIGVRKNCEMCCCYLDNISKIKNVDPPDVIQTMLGQICCDCGMCDKSSVRMMVCFLKNPRMCQAMPIFQDGMNLVKIENSQTWKTIRYYEIWVECLHSERNSGHK